MKKRIAAITLALCMAFSSIGIAFADESANTDTENTTVEEVTEATEATTEEEVTTKEETTKEETTKKTEPTTKKEVTTSEPTTSTTTTTTKSQSSRPSSKYTEEKSEKSVTIAKGESLSLESYIKFTNIEADAFDWSTSDSSMVSVTNDGRISASSKTGTATVTAVGIDGPTRYTISFDVTISEDAQTSTKSVSIYVNDSKDLSGYLSNEYSSSLFSWESDNTKYVSVSSRGVITGERKGSAQVTATYNRGSVSLKYIFNVSVHSESSNDSSNSSNRVKYTNDSNKSSSNTAFIKTKWTFYMGPNDEIDVSDILDESASNYEWSIGDENVVSVRESKGIIEANETGTSRVTADGDNKFTFNINVSDDYSVQELSIRGNNSVSLMDNLSGKASSYVFTSDREDVATVDSTGEVTPYANGVVTIVCDNDDEKVMFFITVSGATSKYSTDSKNNREETTESTTFKNYFTTQATTKAATDFSDISHRQWAVASIKAMASKGIILGVGNGKFEPDKSCTRADFTIVLTKILGIDGKNAKTNYSDVANTDYFYNYVGVAKDNSIECGVAGDKFRPKDNITREEMMVMVYKGLISVQGESMNADLSVLNKYTDASKIAEENKQAVAALVSSGAIAGTSDTTLDVKSNITRAQMAVIMNKVDQMINQ